MNNFIIEENGKKIQQIIRNASIQRLRDFTGMSSFKLVTKKSKQNRDIVDHKEKKSLIIISGSLINVTFKVAYCSDAAKRLSSRVLKMALEEISSDRSNDFFKEYCNLTAGLIKSILKQNLIELSIGHPTHIEDEMNHSDDNLRDAWILGDDDFTVFCSSLISIKCSSIDDYSILILDDKEEEDDVDFF